MHAQVEISRVRTIQNWQWHWVTDTRQTETRKKASLETGHKTDKTLLPGAELRIYIFHSYVHAWAKLTGDSAKSWALPSLAAIDHSSWNLKIIWPWRSLSRRPACRATSSNDRPELSDSRCLLLAVNALRAAAAAYKWAVELSYIRHCIQRTTGLTVTDVIIHHFQPFIAAMQYIIMTNSQLPTQNSRPTCTSW